MKEGYKMPEFSQMPHKGTPIRYRQNRPVRNRQQGTEEGYAGKPHSGCSQEILPRRIWLVCKQEIFFATQQLG